MKQQPQAQQGHSTDGEIPVTVAAPFPPPCLCVMFPSGNENPRDAGRHERGQRAADHGSQAKPCQIASSLGGDAADAAELNADRRKVRKAAQRVRQDRERPRAEVALGCTPS